MDFPEIEKIITKKITATIRFFVLDPLFFVDTDPGEKGKNEFFVHFISLFR